MANEKTQREQEESALFKRWQVALESEGGIADEHTAYTTAIVLENYFNFLSQHPILIAEDKMQTDAFTGVNLALIGIIRRVIPEIIAANELVGMQAMPTPKSPIFTMQFYRNDAKGNTIAEQEMWKPFTSQPTGIGETFDYSSGVVKENYVADAAPIGDQLSSGFYSGGTIASAAAAAHSLIWAKNGNQNKDKTSGFIPDGTAFVLPGSINITVNDNTGAVIFQGYFAGSPYGAGSENIVETFPTPGGATAVYVLNKANTNAAVTISRPALVGTAKVSIAYEISFEGDANQPEMTFKITDKTLSMIKRMLRGRYTLDSAFDVNVLHGINLENEMTNMIKLDLTNGISREIIDDLRKMAGIRYNLNLATYSQNPSLVGASTAGNYNDATMALLDWINRLSAEIANRTRLSRGNWVVANPVSISFLDRVPGFVGSGVNGNERGMGFVGHLGGRLKFYADPQYPIGEYLIGRKGSTPTENGYIHCPYLPITASPTMHNQLTGDPIKIFYTRYGKTFRAFNKETKTFNENQILNGENHYARLIVNNNAPNFSAQALDATQDSTTI
jgi:hypothetical protein